MMVVTLNIPLMVMAMLVLTDPVMVMVTLNIPLMAMVMLVILMPWPVTPTNPVCFSGEFSCEP
jgi:uncharacterized membrane-anchored protein YitT (DUF2179 family)